MIEFDDIDARLEKLGKSRAWLADSSGRKLRSIGDALAPSAVGTSKRSSHLQRALSDAIEAEEARQHAAPPAPDRITIECTPVERREWQAASVPKHQGNLDRWIVDSLNDAARHKLFIDETVVHCFPVPLLRAAAGFPILADAEIVEVDRDLGPGRFLLELRGDSMEPRFRDKQRVVLRDKSTLKRPVLKYGELYCFCHAGAATFKQWAKDGEGNKVLRSLNPKHSDILADEETDWLGWFDPKDNP